MKLTIDMGDKIFTYIFDEKAEVSDGFTHLVDEDIRKYGNKIRNKTRNV